MAESIIGTLADSKNSHNPALSEKRESLRKNTETYTIQSGDTLDGIARNHGVTDYGDLLALNRLLGRNLEATGKNKNHVHIVVGEEIFIPKNLKQFQDDIAGIRKISEAITMNEQIAQGDTKALQKEIHERIFPGFRQSLGMYRLNDGLLGNMRTSLHIIGPRQVDSKYEIEASCAHYYRQDIRSTFNIADMPKSWKKFMNTGNIDAWELPAELLKLVSDAGKKEFTQKANFMHFFDTSKFGQRISPVFSGKEQEYAQTMVQLNEYLSKNPNAINSAIPVYYRYSNYQLYGLEQARSGGEKHYNTHMMRHVGPVSVSFPAYEWGEVHPDGSITSFGGDKKRLEKELVNIRGMLTGEKIVYENQRKLLLEYIKNEFPKHTFIIDKKLEEYARWAKTSEGREVLKKEMEALFDSGNIEQVRTRLSNIIHWPVNEENARLLIHWQKTKTRAREEFVQIQSILEWKKPETYPYFNPTQYRAIFSSGKRVSEVLTSYNQATQKTNGLVEQVSQAQGKIESMKEEEESLEKTRKEASENIGKLKPELDKAKKEHVKVRQAFLESLDETKNPELQTWFAGFETLTKKHFGPNGGSRADSLIQGFRSGNLSEDFRMQMRMTPEDFNYLKAVFLHREKTRKNIASVRARLDMDSAVLPEVQSGTLGNIFSKNPELLKTLDAYNASVAKVNGYMGEIHAREEKMKIKKEIPVVDYLLNFLQQRADYGFSALQTEGRKQLLEGLKLYAGAVKMKVNGKEISISEELKKGAKDQSKVTPEDTIEFSGPVMTEGIHMYNLKDPVERAKMQGRQRFFFELLATQNFFPSEVVEPTKGSLMHRTTFRPETDAIRVKGMYSLNSGDTLENAIKRLIPTYERAEFEKLNPTAPNYSREYRKLLQKYYALQIKGFQLLGYIQSENVLNPGAIKINQAIPYFDTTDMGKQFSEYIAGIKTDRKESTTEMAKYREFMKVQTLPGDTMGTFYNRIVTYTQEYSNHFAKYPNLAILSGLNDFLRKQFLEQLLASSITTANKADIGAMLHEGKVRSGQSFMFRLQDIDSLLGKLKIISYTPSIESMLRPVDRDVVRMVIPMEQNRNIIRSTMYVESYKYNNGKSWIPDGFGRFVKSALETMPIKDINSYGDFQIRGIKDLRKGFGTEYITKKQLENSLRLLSRPDIVAYINSVPRENQSTVRSDLKTIEKIWLILTQNKLSPDDFEKLSEYLLDIVRLDNGSSDNVIGKIIGASLINEKVNGHFQKLDGILRASSQPIEGFRNDPKQMERYEDAVYLINNLGEKNTVLGFAENYLYRVLEGTKILEKAGGRLQYTELQRVNGRGLKYGTQTFLEHVKFITDQVAASKKLIGTTPEVRVTSAMLHFGVRIQEIALKSAQQQQLLTEQIRVAKNPEEALCLRKEWNNSFLLQDGAILKEIYALLSNAEFTKTVQSFGVDTSLLPTKQEIMATDSFRYQLFNHVRKGEKFENMVAVKADKKPV